MKASLNNLKFGIYLEMGFKETKDFGEQWLKESPSVKSSIMAAVYTKEGLPKETYLWAAQVFGNGEGFTNPIVFDALATCYAKGGDYKTAVGYEEKALEIEKKR